MSSLVAPPDVRQLREEDLPRAEFPAGRRSDFRVFFAPDVHERIRRHAAENPRVEVCGVLVGRCARDDDGPFVSITDGIRCEEATSRFSEVTFTHESWARINAEMDTKFAGIGCIVGLVAVITGDTERGGKMIGLSLVFSFIWGAVRLALQSPALQ